MATNRMVFWRLVMAACLLTTVLAACGQCASEKATLHCGRCKVLKYCNKGCQRAHWPEHKAICMPATVKKDQGGGLKQTVPISGSETSAHTQCCDHVKNEMVDEALARLQQVSAIRLHAACPNDRYGMNLLMHAASLGQTKVVEEILKRLDRPHIDDADSEGYTALIHAAANAEADCFELLIKGGANKIWTILTMCST